MIVVITSTVLADLLHRIRNARSQPVEQEKEFYSLFRYLEQHRLMLTPMFPGVSDEGLKVYFVLKTEEFTHENRFMEELSKLPGIEGIYTKPEEELP